jgi:hypothetical protein
MTLEAIGSEYAIERLPKSLQTLIGLERLHLYKPNEFFDSRADPSFDVRYLPHNCAAFEVPCYRVPLARLHVYRGVTQFPYEKHPFSCDATDTLLFPIHPLTLPYYETFLSTVGARNAALDGFVLMGVPTSSVRTLLVWQEHIPEQALFIKTTMMPSAIFGDRRLHANKIGYCVALTKLIQESKASLPGALCYLPEFAGFSPRVKLDSGVILRAIPREVIDGHTVMAPLFSLLGGTRTHLPLLLSMTARTGIQPLEFAEDILCSRFSRLWLRTAMCFGLIPEAHGQNLLLALSPSLVPTGNFYYRDLDGLFVDWELRRALGLPEPSIMPWSWRWYDTYESALGGVSFSDSMWWKLKVSLYAYLHYVLHSLNECLLEWHRLGLIGGATIASDELTMSFSRHMIKNIESLFGLQFGTEYNIYGSMNKFTIFLMKLRKLIIAGKVRSLAPA